MLWVMTLLEASLESRILITASEYGNVKHAAWIYHFSGGTFVSDWEESQYEAQEHERQELALIFSTKDSRFNTILLGALQRSSQPVLVWSYSRKSTKLHLLSLNTSPNTFPSKTQQYASPFPCQLGNILQKSSESNPNHHLSRPTNSLLLPWISPLFHCRPPGFPFWYSPYGGTCETCGVIRELGLSGRWARTTRALGSSFCPFLFFMALPRANRRHILSFEMRL